MIEYAKIIVQVSFPHLLDRIAFIQSDELTKFACKHTSNSEDIALDKILQIWLDFGHSWKEILEGVQRLSKSGANTLDHPVETAIRLLRAASTS